MADLSAQILCLKRYLDTEQPDEKVNVRNIDCVLKLDTYSTIEPILVRVAM